MEIVWICIAILAIFFLWVILYDTHRFVIARYAFVSDKIRQPYKFVMLSDLHSKQYGKENNILLQAIEEERPDAILIAGDMITAHSTESIQSTMQLLAKLKEKYSVYYANGNHEQKIRLMEEKYGNLYAEYMKALQLAGIEPLINAHAALEDKGIVIYGSEIGHEYYQRFHTKPMPENYLKELLGRKREDRYTILIAHNPEYFPEYADWGADLVLSGHIHGGIMRLPGLGGVISPAVRFFPKYDGGLFQEGTSSMVISRGIGTHSPDVRVFNPGELVVVELLQCKS